MKSMLNSFAVESEEILKEMKDNLDTQLKGILNFFECKITPNLKSDNIILQGRVKKPYSLREKIIRKNYHIKYEEPRKFVKDLPDIIGIRLVCLLKDEEKLLFEALNSLFIPGKTKDDYYSLEDGNGNSFYIDFKNNQPEKQKNGKDIYRISCLWKDGNGNETRVELQIKSLVHMFWGEIEHLLFYKNYSYIIGVDFYKKVIESTYSMLESIDSQLKVMRQQMFISEEEEKVAQISQILTKFLYSLFNQNFIVSHGCKIDLREAYELVVQIRFEGITEVKEATTVTQSILQILTTSDDLLKPILKLSPKSKALANNLKELEENDVFWSAFFSMYCNVINEDENINLEKVTKELMGNFLGVFELSRISDKEAFKPLKKSMLDGVVAAFLKYRKMDFFLKNIHGEFTVELLTNFLLTYEIKISEWTIQEFQEEQFKNQYLLIASWIELIIMAKLKNEEITTNSLKELKSLICETDIIWPLNINIDRLEYIINDSKENHISFEKLVSIVEKNSQGGGNFDSEEDN